ncbi:biotin-dependent carboxyltransferase family protein [Knoellia sp. LjRoot47]|uniref:5-oxoprolinase subunit C family protein n=1 Tax=Knoellia sp. LjRoot47 TaxID=3342330 RepID=UPI003ECE2C85
MTPAVEVLDPGPLTLVEDLGRLGHLAVGVGRAGAADVGSYLLGNRLLGNARAAASLEVTFGGLRLRAVGDLLVSLTGARAPADLDGRPAPHNALVELRDGQVLTLGMPSAGLRTYVAVRGGFDVPRTLGSASSDTMSGLGPAPLVAGQVLGVGSRTESFPVLDAAGLTDPPTGTVELDVTPGPRHDWFSEPGALASTTWVASSRSDRRGIRLEGAPLARRSDRLGVELASEGLVRGAIQVPPGGLPVLCLNDAPVTGGYPVIGVTTSASVDRAAQLQPGQQVRFTWCTPT